MRIVIELLNPVKELSLEVAALHVGGMRLDRCIENAYGELHFKRARKKYCEQPLRSKGA
jgi:hypothetical protein